MDRRDLQNLARLRIREAQILFRARQYSGSYYLAGYALECALKACIARQFRRYEFPDRKVVNDSYTHDLGKLLGVAHLEEARLERAGEDEVFRKNWDVVSLWSEASRYGTTDRAHCATFLSAIMEESHGVLPWVEGLW